MKTQMIPRQTSLFSAALDISSHADRYSFEETDDLTPFERVFIQLVKSELEAPDLNLNDHFVDLGGHSLAAGRLVSKIYDRFCVLFPVSVFQEASTLQHTVRLIEAYVVEMVTDLSSEAVIAIIKRATNNLITLEEDPGFALRHPDSPEVSHLPAQLILAGALGGVSNTLPKRRFQEKARLTFSQQQIWRCIQKNHQAPDWNMSFSFEIGRNVDKNTLEQALHALSQRHEALRTAIRLDDQGEPYQSILPSCPISLATISYPEDSKHTLNRVKRWMEVQRSAPFRTDTPSMLRATLINLGKHRQVLFFVVHRIIFDRWSVDILAQDLTQIYGAIEKRIAPDLPRLNFQFADYAEFELLKSAEHQAQLDFWRAKLNDLPEPLNPGEYALRAEEQAYTKEGKNRFTIPRTTVCALKNIAKREGATLFTVLLAAYKAWLRNFTGEEEIIVGTHTATRLKECANHILGPLSNDLAIRTNLSGHPSFEALVRRVKTSSLEAFDNADVPFERIIEALELKDPGESGVFQAKFLFRKAPQSDPNAALPLTLAEVDSGAAHCDLQLELIEANEEVRGWFKYNPELYSKTVASTFADRYLTLLEYVLWQPQLQQGAIGHSTN